MSYIGTPPSNAFTSLLKQDFSTSATTGYTLDHAVNNANDIALFINFVRQEPTAGYAASGTTLTLTSATASSDDMYCVYLGQALQTVNPPNASVGSTQLSPIAITGQTAEATIADGDTILIHDASASALRKMTKANFVSGIGGTNTPAFNVSLNADQTLTNGAFTKILFDLEEFDTDNAFASNKFTVPSGQAGKYFLYSNIIVQGLADGKKMILRLYKNNSAVATNRTTLGTSDDTGVSMQFTLDLAAGDYIEVFCYQNDTGTENAAGSSSVMESSFGGFKIIT